VLLADADQGGDDEEVCVDSAADRGWEVEETKGLNNGWGRGRNVYGEGEGREGVML